MVFKPVALITDVAVGTSSNLLKAEKALHLRIEGCSDEKVKNEEGNDSNCDKNDKAFHVKQCCCWMTNNNLIISFKLYIFSIFLIHTSINIKYAAYFLQIIGGLKWGVLK
jgi:hypothetical protein